MTTEYRIGQVVELSVTFYNTDDEPTDPSVTTLQVRYPDGTVGAEVTTFPDHVIGSGVYEYQLTAEQAGRHYWRWQGTGDVDDVDEGSFYVFRSPVLEAAG